jgi:hypothetical protein
MISEDNEFIFIDFQETGIGHVFQDFITFETCLKIYHEANLDFNRLLEIETKLANNEDELSTSDQVILAMQNVRRAAFLNMSDENPDTYSYGIAMRAFRLLKKNEDHPMENWQKNALLASLLANLLFLEKARVTQQSRKKQHASSNKSGGSRQNSTIQTEDRPTGIEKRTHVFVSYSHKDEQYEEELREHLQGLAYSGIVEFWDDKKLEVGDVIDKVIADKMSCAKVAVFLVSPSFLASHYVRTVELEPLIDAAEHEGAKIIWIPVRSCLMKGTQLEKYHSLIDKNEWLADKDKLNDRDKIYTALVKVISDVIEGVQK